MDRGSIAILESMLYKNPDLRYLYNALKLDCVITSSWHEEHSNITSNFFKPKAIILCSNEILCLIIERSSKTKYSFLAIGQEAYFFKAGKCKAREMIVNKMNESGFIPEPLLKKIIVIDKFIDNGKEVFCKQYVEVSKNKYGLMSTNNLVDIRKIKNCNTLYSVITKELEEIPILNQ